jgi:hypothetical protein
MLKNTPNSLTNPTNLHPNFTNFSNLLRKIPKKFSSLKNYKKRHS